MDCSINSLDAQKIEESKNLQNSIIIGAERTDKYLQIIKGKRAAIMANQTTLIEKRYLVDNLLLQKINIFKIFELEHGFRGNTSAGVCVNNEIDKVTGITIISLYGKKRNPIMEI